MTDRRTRAWAVPAALLLALGALGGCGHTTPPPRPRPPVAVPPPAPPRAGACYWLSFRQADAVTTAAKPVACRHPHTAQTFYVGRIDPISDGHLVAIDSRRVATQIADTCPARFHAFIGGDTQTQRLSRFQTVWFEPSLAQADRGELWFRCDLLALAGRDRLMDLPRNPRGVLGRAGALDAFGTCGTDRPDRPRFVRVACRQPHRWRAIAAVDLIPGARYGGRKATDAAEAHCQDVAASHSSDPLKYQWSFEWPNRDLWRAGQRWGLCWVPDAG